MHPRSHGSLVIPAVLCSFLVVSGAAAASKVVRDQVELLERDIRDLEQRLVALQEADTSSHVDLEKRIDDIREALALDSPGRRSPADLAARLDSVENDVRIVGERQNELTQRMSQLVDRVEALYRRQAAVDAAAIDPAVPVPGEAPPVPLDPSMVPEEAVDDRSGGDARPREPVRRTPGEELVDPIELYDAARADYSRGSYDLAIAGFQEFLDRFPESDNAPGALYWIGESQYGKRDFEGAVGTFDDVGSRYPRSSKAPDAALKKGLALLELNRTAEGILQLQRVRDRYPDTPAAALARQKLQALGLM
jgi:tol-pal system protein YbgF